jgi:hypothetical protein
MIKEKMNLCMLTRVKLKEWKTESYYYDDLWFAKAICGGLNRKLHAYEWYFIGNIILLVI